MPKHHLPEHDLPAHANAGLLLQPARRESRNARSFAHRLYRFLNASALTAVSSRRILTVAILAMAAWLATPTIVQAQEACVAKQVYDTGTSCTFVNDAGNPRYFIALGGSANTGCEAPGSVYAGQTSGQLEAAGGTCGSAFAGNRVGINLGSFKADPTGNTRWTVDAVPLPLIFAATIDTQRYDVNESINSLTLPIANTTGDATLSYSLVAVPPDVFPTGLVFDVDTRVLSGIPTAIDRYSMRYIVNASDGRVRTLHFLIRVTTSLIFAIETVADQAYALNQVISSLTLPEGIGGLGDSSYDLRIVGATGSDPLLPQGLAFGEEGERILSGTPTEGGIHMMIYRVTDELGNTTSEPLYFMIRILAPIFSDTVENQTYTAGRAISAQALPAATNGVNPLTYSLTIQGQSGLPAGLAFNNAADSRVISGALTNPGNYTMTYEVTDGNGISATQNFTITANDPPSFSELVANQALARSTFTTTTLPLAMGGTPPLTYDITTEIPTGLNFNRNSRVLSGLTGGDGTFKIDYTATDNRGAIATLSFTIRVKLVTTGEIPLFPVAPTFSGQTVATQNYFVGRDIIPSFMLPEAMDGTGILSYKLAIQGQPQLSGGFAFDVDTRSLSGTPTTIRSYNMIYTVTDEEGIPDTLLFTITVAEPPAPPVFPEGDLPPRTYTQGTTITDLTPFTEATGGAPPLTYTLLPFASGTGFNFNGATRVLSGTPNLNDRTPNPSFDVTYTVTDGIGSDSRSFTITVNPSLTPTFDGQTVAAQSYTQGTATEITLPEANAGVDALTYSLEGLPDGSGLTFNDATRVLSGTPKLIDHNNDSPLSVTYRVTDSNSVPATDTIPFTITVARSPTPTFDGQTVAAQSYTQGTATEITLPEANAGVDALTYSLEGLPDGSGLTFNDTTRVLSGTPKLIDHNNDSPLSVTYRVTDSNSVPATDTIPFTITVARSPTPTFDGQTVAAQSYTQGTATEITLPEANAGVDALSYSLEGLPDGSGLTFNDATRVLSGTPKLIDHNNDSPLSVTYRVTDSNSVPATDTIPFTITVARSPTPTFDGQTVAAQSYTQGTATEITLPEANAGVDALTYSLEGLPDGSGLTFNDTTRVLSGTPKLIDHNNDSPLSVTYRVTDSNSVPATDTIPFTITVARSPTPTFDGQTVAAQSYTQGTAITDIRLPEANAGVDALTYSLEGLPDGSGLTFNDTTRVLSGTPKLIDHNNASPLSVTYRVTDSNSVPATDTIPFTITVALSPTPNFDGQTVAAKRYLLNQDISAVTLPEATGGTTPLTYTLNIKDQSGLPAGLIFNGTTRILSGTPTAVTPDGAPHQMSYTVSDSNGSAAETPLEFTITIAAEVTALTFTGVPFADQSYTVGQTLPDEVTLPEANGGTGTLTYTLNIKDQSGLPAGLIFDGATRILSGTPTAVTPDGAPHQMSYTVSDSSGSSAATPLEFTITIAAAPTPLTLTGVTFADQSYTVDLPLPDDVTLPEATGGTGTRTYTLNIKDQSGLPAGLIFDGTTRILSGTPTAVTADGAPHQMSYTVSDSSGSSAATPLEFTITIAPEVTLTGVTFADQSYTVDLPLPDDVTLPEATGGTGTRTYTLNIKDQSGLPAGLIFDGTTRILSGTPTAVTADGAPHQMSYTVSDSSGSAAETPLEFTITIAAAPTPLTLTGVTFADQSYTVDLPLPDDVTLPEATGGTGTRTYTLNIKDQSGLPAGLIFDGTTRILSGTPTAVTADGAPHQMSYTVSDSSGSAAATPLEFTITIAAAPTPLTLTGVTFADQSYTVDLPLPDDVTLPEATGGTGTRTYTLNIKDQSGLPAGLIFDGTTRILSGTPTAVTADGAPHQMSYTVSDSSGSAAATPLEFTITIAAAAPTSALTFTGVTFADQSYTVDQTLPANLLLPEATGGTGTRTYTLNIKDQSGLPAGLIFDGTTRILSGTPTAVTPDGTPHQMSYTVSDSSGSAAATPLEFTITIAAEVTTALTFTGVTFADQSYTVLLPLPDDLTLPEATGGTGTRTYTLNIKDQSGLPAGLIFDGTTRILSGTPTAVTADGAPHQMSYTVSDSSGSSAATPLEFTITIAAAAPTSALTFTGVTFADQSYTVLLPLPDDLTLPEATGGTGTRTYTLNIKDQSGLPAGLTFNGTTRILSGTPTAVTTDGAPHQMSYTVSDSSGSSAATPLEFTITIAAEVTTALTFTGVTFADQSYTVNQPLPANLLLPEATGGTTPRTYTLNIKDQSGLPAGLTFNGTTRILSGTPTAVTPDGAPHQMSYTVSDSSGSSAATPLEFTITIAAEVTTALTFTGVTFADQSYTENQPLPANLLLPEATGGTGTRTYTLNIKDQSGLPAGLTFNGTTRILSGTPTAVTPDGAPHQMSYTVSDSSGSSAATPLEFTITIAAEVTTALTFTGVTFADQSYTENQPLPANLLLPEATGGTGTRTYTLNIKDQSGLPAGLIFNGTTRLLSGTPTAVTTAGSPHQMSYTVSDSSGSAAATPLEFTITIAAAAPTSALTFTGVTFADQSYTVLLPLPDDVTLPEATGGTGTRTYTLNIKDQSGLPAGLTFNGTTRILSGTPTAVTTAGSPHQMSYTVSDSSGNSAATPLEFTITIAAAAPTSALTFTGVTFADQSYTVDLPLPDDVTLPEATGGTGTRTYTLNIKDQSGLPAGLTFNGTTRILSGTPTAVTTAGSPHQMSYTVSDSSGSSAATPLEFTITIAAAAPSALTFTGVTFADQSYTQGTTITAVTLPEANGGTTPRTYTLNIKDQSGLPAGLTFNGTTRILSGTPTAVTADGAPHQMSYTVSDSSGSAAATPLEFTITIAAAAPSALTFTGVTFADQSYTQGTTITAVTLPEANGGTAPRTYTLNIKDQSELPAGLTFNGTTRILSGTPTAVTPDGAPHQMSYTVSDSSGSSAATPLEFTITIAAAAPTSALTLDRLERVNRTTLSQVTQVMAANTAASVTARIESLASGGGRASVRLAGQSSLHQALKSSQKLPNSGTLALEKLLDDSSFTLPLAAIGADGSADPGADSAADFGATAVWGSGDYLKFSGGKNKAVSWDGDMLSAHLGVDRRFQSNILVGLAASWYKGRLDYSDSTNTEVVSGKHENKMVLLHPYVGWISSGGVSLWATVGYGWGDIDILEPSQDNRSSDSTLQTAAIGMGGNLLSSEDLIAGGTTTLRLKGDASYAKIKVKDNDAIRGLSVAVRRLRLSLEGSHEQRFDSGARLEPSVVVGLRHDSGDSSETGLGVELGGGLRYIDSAAGVTLAGRGHVLVDGPGNYEEWGANLQFLLDPGIAHQGLSLNLRSLYGETPSERLWDRDLSQVSASANNKVLGHLDMEIGYGLAAPVGPALWTPYSGLMLSSDGGRRYRLGGRFKVGPLFELQLEGDRQEGTDSAQHGILLQGQLRF